MHSTTKCMASARASCGSAMRRYSCGRTERPSQTAVMAWSRIGTGWSGAAWTTRRQFHGLRAAAAGCSWSQCTGLGQRRVVVVSCAEVIQNAVSGAAVACYCCCCCSSWIPTQERVGGRCGATCCRGQMEGRERIKSEGERRAGRERASTNFTSDFDIMLF
ncbi:hypothetical protein AMAG_19022 [Allomyces macrogynus ATCC 38327]|uniref:Uncharacterized protein n=1 Tax=Allomyces macrogynus (strain ATCC 38327) TaxID=578462 RepID=A0A0L0SMH1_ALLM3|nr:hypothetical protein AMAG_19022 [Allomyces macrogynus ATCC 38327]|eukprot:KNE63580.1 hypothetical protein AMAG_19022 [Allomyces macrogynus ATCC 38327]